MIEPHIPIGEPGQAIILYQGSLEAIFENENFILDNSTIFFVFLPQPRIEFHFIGADTFCFKSWSSNSFILKIKLPNYNILLMQLSLKLHRKKQKLYAYNKEKK